MLTNCTSGHYHISSLFLSFYNLQYSYCQFQLYEKTQETHTAKLLKLQDDSVFDISVPLSYNTACATFTTTPERAHQKSNITVADVSAISASENEIGRM